VENEGARHITWIMGAGYGGVYGTDFTVETSTSLKSPWTTESPGASVTITGSEVRYTFPSSARRFARLKVLAPIP
jgi:hypothetical protein